jgi:O-antigen/teichoic acid export membrane protein
MAGPRTEKLPAVTSEKSGSPSAAAVRQMAVGAGTTFAAKVTNTGIKFLTQIVLCRLLGASGFGLYSLALVISQVGELFAGMGLESGSIRYVSIHHGEGDAGRLKGVLLHSLAVPLVGGLVLATALFILAEPLARDVFDEPGLAIALRIVAIAMPFGAVMTVLGFASTGFGVTHYLAAVWTLHPTLNLVLATVLCAAGAGVIGAASAWTASGLVGAVVAFAFIRRAWPELTSAAIRPVFALHRLLAFSLPLALGNLLWLVLLWTDVLALGYFSTADDVGIYRATSQTSLLLTLIIVSINTIFAPMIAGLLNRKEHRQTREVFQTSARWSLTATVPIFLVLAVLGGQVLRIFGAGFEVGAVPLLILAIGQLVTAGTGSCGQVLVMSGHQYLKLFGDLGMAVMNVVLNILLIPRWGLVGAAVATAVSVAAVHVLRLVQVWWVLRLSPYNWRFLKILLPGLAAGACGMVTRPWLDGWHYLAALTAGGAAMMIVYGLLLFVSGLEPEDRSILNDVVNKARGAVS